MVYRVYVEKKAELANEARALQHDLRAFLGIRSLTGLRLYNRYDLEGISRELFDYTVKTVLSEPQLDLVTDQVPQGDAVFAVEYLPGQFDQRADSAAQCIQILSQGERPAVRTARVYALEGVLTPQELEAVKQYVINPVESREASADGVHGSHFRPHHHWLYRHGRRRAGRPAGRSGPCHGSGRSEVFAGLFPG